MLATLHRFHGHGSLRYVYKNGVAVRSRLIILKVTPNSRRKHSRFAVIVGKKVIKSAVRRNRIRRRVYEAIRQELPNMTAAYDVAVIIVSSDVLTISHEELTNTLHGLVTEAGLCKN